MTNEKHQTIKKFDSAAFAFAGGVGPWVAPIAPAFVFGYAFFESLPDTLGLLAIIPGIVAGIGLVIAGAFTSHNAIERGGLWWAAAIGYVLLEIGGLWAMSIDLNMQVVGTVLALITFLVYISRAGAAQIGESKAKAEQSEAAALAFERQRILADDERRYNRQMEQDRLATQARIETTKSQHGAEAERERVRLEAERLRLEREREQAQQAERQRLAEEKRRDSERKAEAERLAAAKLQAEIEASRITCDGCGREFEHQNGLNAHKPHCKRSEAATEQQPAKLNGNGSH
jgi:hypothetical protein